MTTSSPDGPPRGRGAFPSPLTGGYMAGCTRDLSDYLPPLLATLFVNVDDALYDLADKATSSRPYTVYFDAMRVVRKQSHGIKAGFLRLLRQTSESAAAGLLECDLLCDSDAMSQDFSLQQETDLEETLAVNNLVSKAESRYSAELTDINAWLAQLLDRDRIDMRSNPFGPSAVCEAFRGALNGARQLETQIKLVIYKVFDKQVLDHLGPFYRQCLERAAAVGYVSVDAPIAGPAPPPPERPPERPPVRPADPPHGHAFGIVQDSDGGIGLDPGSDDDTTQVAFETLQDLLGRRRTPPGGPADTPRPLPTHELQGLLTELGSRLLADGNAVGGAVRERLIGVLGSPEARRRGLQRNDQDTLDLVFMFFEHLCEGGALPEPIKVLLGRMQIPIAKLALLDKGFFSRPDHPARQLLNHIGEAAVGWCESDGRGPETLFGMIERVVERLILDFDGDPRLFAQMDRFFLAYTAHEQAHTREAEARVLAQIKPTAGGGGAAKQVVAAALDSALIRVPQVPAVVESILREGWQSVMLAAYGGGTDSPEWRATLDLVDRLLWSVQPKTHSEERRQLLRRIPEILRVLRSRLASAGCDQRQLASWFRDLQTLHLAVLQGGQGTPASAARPPAAARPSPKPAATATANGTRAAAPGTTAVTVSSIPLGTWIELGDNGAPRSRFKLVWRSPGSDRLQFVDRQGRPGPELSGRELAERSALGRATLLGRDLEPVADRAMRAVLGRLAANS